MASQVTIPKVLNWVEKRAACSVAGVFNELFIGIQDDVIAVNSARGLSGNLAFEAKMVRADTIEISQPKLYSKAKTIITASDSGILVAENWDSGKQWSATVGLNNEGLCALRLEDSNERPELQQWQFRKRALEDLFFVHALAPR